MLVLFKYISEKKLTERIECINNILNECLRITHHEKLSLTFFWHLSSWRWLQFGNLLKHTKKFPFHSHAVLYLILKIYLHCCKHLKFGHKAKTVPFGPVPTTPKEYRNTSLFLQLGLPSTLIRRENGTFRLKRSSKTGIWKSRLYVLVWTELNHFENEPFQLKTMTLR